MSIVSKIKYLFPQTFGGEKSNLWNEIIGAFLREHFTHYAFLSRLIRKRKCRRLLEIGVAKGDGAIQMISAAKDTFNPKEVQYYGFDTFGKGLPDDEPCEGIGGLKLERVEKKLEDTGVKISLFKGNTNSTLPEVIDDLPPIDFAFIDGGHSFETVKNDWKFTKKVLSENSIVVFHDYNLAGPKKVVKSINRDEYEVNVIPCSPFGEISMALIEKR